MTQLNSISAHWSRKLSYEKWEKESGAQRLLTSTVSEHGGLCCKWWDNDARLKPFDCYIYFWQDSFAVELKILKDWKLKFQPHQKSILDFCAKNHINNHLIGVISEHCWLFFGQFYTAAELLGLEAAGELSIAV